MRLYEVWLAQDVGYVFFKAILTRVIMLLFVFSLVL